MIAAGKEMELLQNALRFKLHDTNKKYPWFQYLTTFWSWLTKNYGSIVKAAIMNHEPWLLIGNTHVSLLLKSSSHYVCHISWNPCVKVISTTFQIISDFCSCLLRETVSLVVPKIREKYKFSRMQVLLSQSLCCAVGIGKWQHCLSQNNLPCSLSKRKK